MEKIKLDVIDRRILFLLDSNSRMSITEMAKTLRTSKERVLYRIRRIESFGVIEKYMTIMDTAKLGYTTYKTLLSFHNTSEEKEKEIIEFLVNDKNTQYVCVCSGAYDLNVNFIVKDFKELNDKIQYFLEKYGEYIGERVVNVMVETYFFPKKYLLPEGSKLPLRKKEKILKFGSVPRLQKIDEIDIKIIKMLSKDSRISYAEISREIGISGEAVRKRVKRLESNGVLQGYNLTLNYPLLGYSLNTALLKFKKYTPELEKKLLSFCKLNEKVWFYSKMVGYWDAAINYDFRTQEEGKEFIRKIKLLFADVLDRATFLYWGEIKKFDQYPFD